MLPTTPRDLLGVAKGIGSWSSFSVLDAETIAHESGTTATCTTRRAAEPGGPDRYYPYGEGNIGAWGYDFGSGELVPPGQPDFMSYCEPTWTSDYQFTNAVRYRLKTETGSILIAAADAAQAAWGCALVLWGPMTVLRDPATGRIRGILDGVPQPAAPGHGRSRRGGRPRPPDPLQPGNPRSRGCAALSTTTCPAPSDVNSPTHGRKRLTMTSDSRRHPLSGRLVLAAVLVIAACENPVAPVSCATPESVLTAPDHTVERTFCFTDANMDDVLSYAVNVLNPGIARAMVFGTDRVAVTGLEEGTTTVEIVATDPGGLAATVSIPVEVVAPMSGSVTACRGTRVGGLVQATVEGTVTANLPLGDVSIGAYIDGALVGRQFVGDMRRGQTEDVSITGPDFAPLSERHLRIPRKSEDRRRFACRGAAAACPGRPGARCHASRPSIGCRRGKAWYCLPERRVPLRVAPFPVPATCSGIAVRHTLETCHE